MNLKFNYISLALSAILVGCGGGSDGNESASDQDVKVGYFKDASVEGVEYKTTTQSGITGKGGSFNYVDGEKVRFSIGTLNIGETKAAPIITPIELTSFLYPSDTENVNIVRVLMSLDEDDIYSNGIQISTEVLNYLKNEIDLSLLDIKSESGVNSFESEMTQLLPGLTIPTANAAIEHFNQTVRCNLSGVFYGEYEGEGEGIFVVAIDPETLTPRGAFKPDGGYEYQWFGLSGSALKLKGGAQPVALGRSDTDNDEYSDVVFSAVFDGLEVNGQWAQSGETGGAIVGEKFVSSDINKAVKYVGTYRNTDNDSDVPTGIMQVTISENDLKSVDWYDFSENKQRHQGSAFNGGSVYIDLNNREDSADQILEFTVEKTAGDVIDETITDSQGNDIELKLSSCRI